MPVLTNLEPRFFSDWLKQVGDGHYSYEEVTILSGQGKLATGTVVGRVTASGKWKAVTVAAADGSQTAAGIVLRAGDATSADAEAVIVARDAVVMHQGLLYGADVNDAAKRAAVHAALRALNPPILVREGA